ncbi:hypothetical protein HALLA_07130 [Halostagnicola larsenii XH-48]|uniref:DUF8156 domain-containing protein n=1 Tax=Halostagnicola larsenii XH-48 TaxID=797299 RepID=W0JNS7_9EURY|nr:hypothetical protein [Halostagnicola larsenii]AHF98657.1 hypothetical protein HALLA_07130 [Halostagnicola larsenii XH-48]
MGRTNPTYRDAAASLESEWRPMRRALRREYQDDFDRLFERARGFADAAGHANATDPERALLLSVLLAHEVELRQVRGRLEEAERRLEDAEGRLERVETGLERTETSLETTETEFEGEESP